MDVRMAEATLYQDEEIWKSVTGYESIYEISSHGRVKSLRRTINGRSFPEKVLKQFPDPRGRPCVAFSKESKKDHWRVHQLVAIHFVSNQHNHPCVCHKDDVLIHNHYRNLYWGTMKANMQDRGLNGHTAIGEKNGKSKLTELQVMEIKQLKHKYSSRVIGEIFGISHETVRMIHRNITWKHIK
jgi:hypothetical protein